MNTQRQCCFLSFQASSGRIHNLFVDFYTDMIEPEWLDGTYIDVQIIWVYVQNKKNKGWRRAWIENFSLLDGIAKALMHVAENKEKAEQYFLPYLLTDQYKRIPPDWKFEPCPISEC